MAKRDKKKAASLAEVKERLRRSEYALHEWIGMVWYRIKS